MAFEEGVRWQELNLVLKTKLHHAARLRIQRVGLNY